MTSRVLGVVREQVLASLFGAGNAMDAYNVAFRIPNLLRDLFAEGAMSAAFVPTFTRHLTTARQGLGVAARQQRHQRAARRSPACWSCSASSSPSRWSPLFAGDYASVPGKLELTVLLTRIMLPFLTFVALAAAVMGMLNSLHHFFIPALSPAMFNVATIVCALALVPLMPRARPAADRRRSPSARCVGGVAQLALQWPLLRREGFRYRPTLDWSDAGCGACCC